jgi:hypothetical protein
MSEVTGRSQSRSTECAVRWDDVVRHTCQGHGRGQGPAHRCPCGSVLLPAQEAK